MDGMIEVAAHVLNGCMWMMAALAVLCGGGQMETGDATARGLQVGGGLLLFIPNGGVVVGADDRDLLCALDYFAADGEWAMEMQMGADGKTLKVRRTGGGFVLWSATDLLAGGAVIAWASNLGGALEWWVIGWMKGARRWTPADGVEGRQVRAMGAGHHGRCRTDGAVDGGGADAGRHGLWLDLNGVVAGSEMLDRASGSGGLKADGCCRRLERGRSWWKLLGVADLFAMGRWRRGVLGEDERRRGDGSSTIVVEAELVAAWMIRCSEKMEEADACVAVAADGSYLSSPEMLDGVVDPDLEKGAALAVDGDGRRRVDADENGGRQRWRLGCRRWSLGKMMMEHHTGAPCSGEAL
ncbi:hypothetical protein ACLOJK_017519 [Asimina triloba]